MSIEDFQKQSRALRPKQKVETRVIDSSDLVPTRSGANNKSSKFNKQQISTTSDFSFVLLILILI